MFILFKNLKIFFNMGIKIGNDGIQNDIEKNTKNINENLIININETRKNNRFYK
jgi:hypothetical protein